VANRAVLDGLAAIERRHGWKGNLLNVIAAGGVLDEFRHPDWRQPIGPGSYVHALVTNVLPYQVSARVGQQQVIVGPDGFAWTGQRDAEKFLRPGDIIYVRIIASPDTNLVFHATLEQDSGLQGSLMAVDNASGEVLAMVGGRDFNLSQFNRATQAERQVGSSFKPYVYTAAVDQGVRPEEIIVDAPVTFTTAVGPYTPHNYDNTFEGPISLLHAFADSRNIPAVKIAERVGMRKVIATAHQFGLTSNIPPFLPVALGSVEATLQEQVAAFSSFPNDGVRLPPHLIRKVTNVDGLTLSESPTAVAESTSMKTARIMMTFLKSVMQYGGTGAGAAVLHHPLGGKTGTTSDFNDAWFIGFSPSITCGTWVGYDNRQSIGDKESGGHAALPMWVDFMKAAIADRPDEHFAGDVRPAPSATNIAAHRPTEPSTTTPQ
jgi:penicillin-binding protein 1A